MFREIIHPTDFSVGDSGAFAHSLRIGLAGESEVTLLHVSDNRPSVHWTDFPQIRETLTRWQFIPANATRQMVEATGLSVKKAIREGKDPVREIATYLEQHPCDLIILATHQRSGLSSWWQQSKSAAIARDTKTMTLFVPRQVQGFVSTEIGCVQLRNILVPIANKPKPRNAVRAAEAIGSLFSLSELRIEFLHVGPQDDAPSINLPDHSGWTVEQSAWKGNVVEHILDTSETQNIDLIVMATEGHHGFLDALRGSTTEQIVKQAKCPVLAVPA
ncbi:MAG: hypothetical protein M2R45_00089 [Verrucomicrobia subdivision 3 bacterium]|nr:hypothetical protein [Limisphaerales bacterium]MCS1412453.1 hypothetical protein [Limisphaerales bacterium]